MGVRCALLLDRWDWTRRMWRLSHGCYVSIGVQELTPGRRTPKKGVSIGSLWSGAAYSASALVHCRWCLTFLKPAVWSPDIRQRTRRTSSPLVEPSAARESGFCPRPAGFDSPAPTLSRGLARQRSGRQGRFRVSDLADERGNSTAWRRPCPRQGTSRRRPRVVRRAWRLRPTAPRAD